VSRAEVRLVFNNLEAGWQGRKLALSGHVGRGLQRRYRPRARPRGAETQVKIVILQEKPMTTMNLVLLIAFAVVVVLYMGRRRNRLNQED
jgi:hypothetical protein